MERELREVKAAFALHQEQVGVQVTNLSASTSTLFSEQNSHIGNRMSEFLQNLEERPTPWNAVLDDYERRIKALEEKFLFWLEALSVLGAAREAVDALGAIAKSLGTRGQIPSRYIEKTWCSQTQSNHNVPTN